MNATTIGIDPGRVTGWAVAVDGHPVAWGQGEAEEAADAILREIKDIGEPVTVLCEAAFQGRFGAGVAVAYRAGLTLGILRAGLPAGSTVAMAPATQWRRAMGWSRMKRQESKKRAMAHAFSLTQDADVKRPTREHVAEAICMATVANQVAKED